MYVHVVPVHVGPHDKAGLSPEDPDPHKHPRCSTMTLGMGHSSVQNLRVVTYINIYIFKLVLASLSRGKNFEGCSTSYT